MHTVAGSSAHNEIANYRTFHVPAKSVERNLHVLTEHRI